jgi:hypothetical protein
VRSGCASDALWIDLLDPTHEETMVETLLGFRCRPGTRGMDPPGSPASNEGWERGKAGRCLLESFRKRGRQAIAGLSISFEE